MNKRQRKSNDFVGRHQHHEHVLDVFDDDDEDHGSLDEKEEKKDNEIKDDEAGGGGKMIFLNVKRINLILPHQLKSQ